MTTSRRRALVVAIIILCGLGAGFFLRAEWAKWQFTKQLEQVSDDRAETMAYLFEAFCLGELRGHRLNPKGLLKPIFYSGQESWLDEASKLRVYIDLVPPKLCAVSDDVALLSADERNGFRAIVDARIERWTPKLTKIAPQENEFFRLDAWTTLEADPYLRWGIVLYQLEETGPESFTSIHIGLPSPEHFERRRDP